MSLTDPVADMLTKIRNASSARFESVDIPTSKLKLEITKILKNEGYIKTFKKVTQDGRNLIRIFLKYDGSNEPVIHGLKRISTPGRRMYAGYRTLPRVLNGFGTIIVTTSLGVTTGKKALEKKAGGEAALQHLVGKEKAVSRIGRLPVKIPKGVKVSLQPGSVLMESSKGKVTQAYDAEVNVAVEGDSVVVTRVDDTRKAKSLHGLYRNLLKNTLIGLSEGFSKILLITGVGYKAEVKGKSLVLNLGYSTPIEYPIPAGVTMEVDQNVKITVKGTDRQQVGQICSEIRSFRVVEPYKGKGIKYDNEYVRRKVGKSGIK